LTVTIQTNYSISDGDDSTTVFGFTFAVPTASTGTDIYVYIIDDTGTITLITSNYTLDLSAKTVTYPNTAGITPLDPGVAALPSGWQIAIYRVEPLTQVLNLTTQGPFPSAGMMASLDQLEYQIQQIQEQLNRCVKYPIGQAPTTTDVNDFIAAVNAIIAPPPIYGSYTYVKSIAALAPTTFRTAFVNDQNSLGAWQFFIYSGNVAAGDGGWFGPLSGGG
jgi:hypothetical protein